MKMSSVESPAAGTALQIQVFGLKSEHSFAGLSFIHGICEARLSADNLSMEYRLPRTGIWTSRPAWLWRDAFEGHLVGITVCHRNTWKPMRTWKEFREYISQ